MVSSHTNVMQQSKYIRFRNSNALQLAVEGFVAQSLKVADTAIKLKAHKIVSKPFALPSNSPVSFYSILFYPITLEGRRGTTDEFATIPFHLDLFSAALVELAKSIPVHSLIMSCHLFFCLPLFLFPFTVP